MQTKKTKDKGEKEKSNGFNFAPPGHGMNEMMEKCCAGRGGFHDCSAKMKAMMKQHWCTPNAHEAESKRRKK